MLLTRPTSGNSSYNAFGLSATMLDLWRCTDAAGSFMRIVPPRPPISSLIDENIMGAFACSQLAAAVDDLRCTIVLVVPVDDAELGFDEGHANDANGISSSSASASSKSSASSLPKSEKSEGGVPDVDRGCSGGDALIARCAVDLIIYIIFYTQESTALMSV